MYNLCRSLEVVKQAGDYKAVTVLNRQLRYTIKILLSLKVQEKRVEYFSYINRLKALGLLTIGILAAWTAKSAFSKGTLGKGTLSKVILRKYFYNTAAAVTWFL